MKPEDLAKTKKEALIEALQNLNVVNEQTMAEMVMIREELLHRLKKAKKDGELIGEYSVTKAKRVTFKTTIEEAEPLGAIKQAVDASLLRKLYNKGIKVPGAKVTTYLSVRRLSQDEAEK